MPTWVRCRDRDTGAEYDLQTEPILDYRLEKDLVDVLEDYPANTGLTAQPRAAKHRVNLEPVVPPETPPADVSTDQPEGSPPDDNPPAVMSAPRRRN